MPAIDESLIINTRLRKIEAEREEEKKRDAKYKNRHLTFNKWTVMITAGLLIANVIYDRLTADLARTSRLSADAAISAAASAREALILQGRPWVKIKHRILSPLTFEVERHQGPFD